MEEFKTWCYKRGIGFQIEHKPSESYMVFFTLAPNGNCMRLKDYVIEENMDYEYLKEWLWS